ncbi:MAG: hypothetical protein M3O50_20850, partial [Myxococcota bacterium]|nr:hypothetical protein [Myxococcota bacterium]
MTLRPLACYVVSAAAAGCAGTVSSETVDANTTASASAIVIVERTVDSAHGARAEASARFVRVATPATSSEALRAIGAEIDLPRPGT